MLGLWQELLVAWSSRVVQCIMTLDRSTYVHAGYVGHAVAVRNPQHAEKLSYQNGQHEALRVFY